MKTRGRRNAGDEFEAKERRDGKSRFRVLEIIRTSGRLFDDLENVPAYPARGHADSYTLKTSTLESRKP
jgi:hypothetical protein